MSVDIIIPFQARSSERSVLVDYVKDHYKRAHPDWKVTVATLAKDKVWSKGAAVNGAVAKARGDVLVIADADSIVDPASLEKAVRWVGNDDRHWAVPHATIHRLTEESSDWWTEHYGHADFPDLGRLKLDKARSGGKPYRSRPGGGVTVVDRVAFVAVRGIDPRFEGWGGEDESFGWKLQRTFGHAAKAGGDLVHLWHPIEDPTTSGVPKPNLATIELTDRYRTARGRDMQALIGGQPEII